MILNKAYEIVGIGNFLKDIFKDDFTDLEYIKLAELFANDEKIFDEYLEVLLMCMDRNIIPKIEQMKEENLNLLGGNTNE